MRLGLRVRGKGNKLRFLPLAPESVQLLDHYLRLERPDPCSAALFVSLKGHSRGARMTATGLRSLFRHHRHTTGVPLANPHRFRHTFASDMVRAGVSLPALMQLMGHADIQTTLRYVQVNSPRRLPAVCPRRGPAHSAASEDCLVSARRPPLSHPLAPVLDRAVDSLSAALNPETTRHYRGAVRKFLTYLGAVHPEVSSLDQLRRDPTSVHSSALCGLHYKAKDAKATAQAGEVVSVLPLTASGRGGVERRGKAKRGSDYWRGDQSCH
jgi:hypothetical protein